MLSNKIIVYDDNCPMCSLYTQAFVRLRLLEPDHRVGFAYAGKEIMDRLDLARARHEIPLLDTETGEVVYGMDALFLIISHRFPMLRPLFGLRLFRTVIYGLYQIISFNRRVIAGTASPRTGFDCAPDFNFTYRALYLLLAVSLWAALIVALGHITGLVGSPALQGALLAAGGLQAMMFGLVLRSRQKWDYLGNTVTNALVFGLLALPMLLFTLPPSLLGANLLAATVVSALDYSRRLHNIAR